MSNQFLQKPSFTVSAIFLPLGLLLFGSVCYASGWNDYILDIGDGYKILRANSFDITVIKTGRYGECVFQCPRTAGGSGPLGHYITTPDYIFTKHYGIRAEKDRCGAYRHVIDSSQASYFIIVKSSDTIVGPMTAKEFLQRPEIQEQASLEWKKPKNPNFWLPLVGTLMFLSFLPFLLVFLAIRFYWITGLIVLGIFWYGRRKGKKRAAEEAQGTQQKENES